MAGISTESLAYRLVAVGLALSVLGCAGRGSESLLVDTPQQPVASAKPLVIGLNGVPRTLSAKLNQAGGGNQKSVGAMAALISAGLAVVDAQGNLQPQLAEAVPTLENRLWKLFDDGRMEVTWKIAPGARWHDGVAFTAGDLLFTLAVAQDKEIAGFGDVGIAALDSVSAPDPRTAVAVWRQPYVNADSLFTEGFLLPLPRHLLNETFTADKPGFTQHPYWTSAFVGAGPFQLKEWGMATNTAILEANDSYVLGRPKIDRVEVKFFSDTNALILSVLAGAVDFVPGSQTLSYDQGMAVKTQWNGGRVDLTDAPGREYMIPNLENPVPAVIRDVRFRRALMHATNRDLIAESVGGVNPGDSYIDVTDRDYPAVASSVVRYDYDVRKAIQLIDETGYVKGPDGFYRSANAQRLTVESRTPAAFDIGVKVQSAIADNWRAVGVDVDEVAIPQQMAQDKQYRGTFPGFEMVHQGSGLSGLKNFYSSEAVGPQNNYLGKNRSRYKNPELDALIDAVFVTIPRQERQQVLAKIVHLISDQLTIMFMPDASSPALIGNRVRYVEPTPDFSNVHRWQVS